MDKIKDYLMRIVIVALVIVGAIIYLPICLVEYSIGSILWLLRCITMFMITGDLDVFYD